mmetsp:Transcript_10534/g.30078  ORF Transcript_10534/g.30078 Transcript_10534/m.30078 type:complete len:234 (-) Transcript_10534:579-1280(-)
MEQVVWNVIHGQALGVNETNDATVSQPVCADELLDIHLPTIAISEVGVHAPRAGKGGADAIMPVVCRAAGALPGLGSQNLQNALRGRDLLPNARPPQFLQIQFEEELAQGSVPNRQEASVQALRAVPAVRDENVRRVLAAGRDGQELLDKALAPSIRSDEDVHVEVHQEGARCERPQVLAHREGRPKKKRLAVVDAEVVLVPDELGGPVQATREQIRQQAMQRPSLLVARFPR